MSTSVRARGEAREAEPGGAGCCVRCGPFRGADAGTGATVGRHQRSAPAGSFITGGIVCRLGEGEGSGLHGVGIHAAGMWRVGCRGFRATEPGPTCRWCAATRGRHGPGRPRAAGSGRRCAPSGCPPRPAPKISPARQLRSSGVLRKCASFGRVTVSEPRAFSRCRSKGGTWPEGHRRAPACRAGAGTPGSRRTCPGPRRRTPPPRRSRRSARAPAPAKPA